MKKHLLHSALILTVLFSQLYNSTITALYQMNYDYYSNTLCENKDKPDLHCDGKCYFAKQLKLKEDSQKPGEPPLLLPNFTLFANAFPKTKFQTPEVAVQSMPDLFLDISTKSPFLADIDHPPKV